MMENCRRHRLAGRATRPGDIHIEIARRPVQLVDLASQVSEFAAKLEALPPVRRRQPMMQKSEHLPPDQSVQAGITA